MPFRNSVVAAVISTALAGSRIVIDGTGTLANYIRFYTGKATESAPATITGRSYGPADPSYPDALYLGLEGARHTDDPLRQPATLRLITTPGPNMALVGEADYITLQSTAQTSVRSAGVAEIDADIITLGKYSLPLTDPPALRLGAFSTTNVLGPWVPYTFTISSAGTQPTKGASTTQGYYMRIGKLVVYRFRFVSGAGWAPGTGDYYISLPVTAASGSPSSQLDCGSGFIYNAGAAGVYAGNWYTQSPSALRFMIANSPGSPYMGAGQMAAGSNFGGTIWYEAA